MQAVLHTQLSHACTETDLSVWHKMLHRRFETRKELQHLKSRWHLSNSKLCILRICLNLMMMQAALHSQLSHACLEMDFRIWHQMVHRRFGNKQGIPSTQSSCHRRNWARNWATRCYVFSNLSQPVDAGTYYSIFDQTHAWLQESAQNLSV